MNRTRYYVKEHLTEILIHRLYFTLTAEYYWSTVPLQLFAYNSRSYENCIVSISASTRQQWIILHARVLIMKGARLFGDSILYNLPSFVNGKVTQCIKISTSKKCRPRERTGVCDPGTSRKLVHAIYRDFLSFKN